MAWFDSQSQSNTPQTSDGSLGGSSDNSSGGWFSGNQTDSSSQTDSTLKPLQLDHPLEAAYSVFHGALDDLGGVVSGLGKIAYTPAQIGINLTQGKMAFDNTILGSMANLINGAAGQITGGNTTPEWDGMKQYYGQYFTHPVDMIANHPVNTLLDLASILDFGATSANVLARTGEVNDLTKAARVAQEAGDFEKANALAKQAEATRAATTAGKISDTLSTIQHNINPITGITKGIGATFTSLGSKIPALDSFNSWVQNLTNRSARLGLSDEEGNRFFKTADILNSQKELYNDAFRNEIEPLLKPLINNPARADLIADGLDRPSLLTDPADISTRDMIQSVFDKYVTEPERAGGILKNWIDGGYLEHVYEDNKPGFFKSFKVNAPNNNETQLLRFDSVKDPSSAPVIGSAAFHNLTEVNKDAELLKLERSAATTPELKAVAKELIDTRQELADLADRRIAHPEDFQTETGGVANALEIKDQSLRIKANELRSQLGLGDSPYNTALRLFKDGEGNLYKASRPTRSELMSIGMKPKDLFDSLDHRATTSALNQAKLKLGTQLGEEFGSTIKPEDPLAPNGQPWVKSSIIKDAQGNPFYLPKNVDEAAQKFFAPSAPGEAIVGLHYFGQIFKKFLYANPLSAAIHGFHLGFLGYLGGALDPVDLIRNWVGRGDEIDSQFNRMVGKSDLEHGYFETGGKTLKEEITPKSPLQKAISVVNPASPNFVGQNVTQAALEHSDDFLRKTIFRKALHEGLTTDEAMARANQYMGNYADLTPTERNLQALFPFYNWMKTSLGTSINSLTDNPLKYDIPRLLSGQVNPQGPNDEEKLGKIDSGLKDANGNEKYFSLPIPLKDVRNLFADAPSFMWTRVNPGVTIPVDIAANNTNPFNTDPNFARLNQIYDPNTAKVGMSSFPAELKFAAGQIINPFKILSDNKTLDEKALEAIGVYSSSYDPKKTDYYSVKDAKAAITELKGQYKKAVKAQDLPQAAFYQRAIQLWEQQLQGAVQQQGIDNQAAQDQATPTQPSIPSPSNTSSWFSNQSTSQDHNTGLAQALNEAAASGGMGAPRVKPLHAQQTQTSQNVILNSGFHAQATPANAVRSELPTPRLSKPPTVQTDDLPKVQSFVT